MEEMGRDVREDSLPASVTARPKIERALLRSHLALAAVGLLVMLVSVAATVSIRSTTESLAVHHAPTVEAAVSCDAGLERSLAALRGWVLLGEPQFQRERLSAWNVEIRPALARLQTLSILPGSTLQPDELDVLEVLLEDLYAAQWAIEDIAHTPGNEPATFILTENTDPIFRTLITATSAMLEVEKNQPPDEHRRRALATMADFRYTVTRTSELLSEVVVTGSASRARSFEHWYAEARAQLAELEALSGLLDQTQVEMLAVIESEFKAFGGYAQHCIEARLSPQWNTARYWLSSRAVAKAREAQTLLANLAAQKRTEMFASVQRVNRMGDNTVVALAFLVFLGVALAIWLARARARAIAGPIQHLASATREMATGRLDESIPLLGPFEIAALTDNFNIMRRDLRAREALLRASEAKHRALAEELERISRTDALTGIANRRAMDNYLEMEWRRAQREGYSFGFVLLDIDCFKQFNDNYGHQAGDECLCAVAKELAGQLRRASDMVARYGGEEFAVVLPGADAADVTAIAEELRMAVVRAGIRHAHSSVAGHITISLGGAANLPTPELPFTGVVEQADQALYRSKQAGRNRFTLFEPSGGETED